MGNQIGVFGTNVWVIWRTTNGGAEWDSVGTGIQFTAGVELSDGGVGLASGRRLDVENNIVKRTTDFGQSWNPGQHPPIGNTLRNLDWIEGTSEVWGVTVQGGVWQSTNEGMDWIQHVLAIPNEFATGDLDLVDSQTGWCVGERLPNQPGPGRIFKYSSTTAVTSSFIPAPLSIWTQPNPFSNDVEFVIEGAQTEPMEISIYDVTGRRLWTHVAGGRNAHRWDGRGPDGGAIASGVYFYRVLTKAGELSGRLVKAR